MTNSPPSRVIKDVLVKLLARMGIQLTIENIKPGYYPKGGGQLKYNVKVDGKVIALEMLKFVPPTVGTLKYYSFKN